MTVTLEKALGGCFAVSLAAVLLVPFLLVFNGWVFAQVWAWYILPLGAPAVTLYHGIGASLLFDLLFGPRSWKRADSTLDGWMKLAEPVVSAFMIPSVILLYAWLGHMWLGPR